jgi:transcriptional/translational regulatory protein YebC/TACO1
LIYSVIPQKLPFLKPGFTQKMKSGKISIMSGHSKWANIKRQKGVNDAKKSKIFSKISRLITVAAKNGGGDPEANSTLRLAVEKAHEARMPKENIEKAIAKGTGQGGAQIYYDAIYEGYGPSGEAFYITALTDNKNRTVADIRNIFSKYGGSLGGAGSTAYIFTPDPENPTFTMEINDPAHAASLEHLLEEIEDHDDVQDVYVNFVLPDHE